MPNPSKIINDEYFAARSTVNTNTGCVEWKLHRNKLGYGTLKYKQKAYMAHRFHWEYKNGKIPEGLIICHKCDNPCCINIDHLFVGTYKDNSEDMKSKGRGRYYYGEEHPSSKLTEELIISIKSDTRSQYEIAKHFGISQSMVSQIKTNKSWSSVDFYAEDKKMNVREFADSLGLPYSNLKDRIFGGYMSIREAVDRTADQFDIEIVFTQ